MPLPDQIADAIGSAPRFAVLGLSMRNERLRERARHELALFIAEQLQGAGPAADKDQLPLPL